MALLEIKNLSVSFKRENQDAFCAVKNISFDVEPGQVVGLVGESGSGKSVTALSVLGLLPYPKAFYSKESSIILDNHEIVGACEKILRKIRGSDVGFIFQEPMSSLNPLHKIGKQIAEILKLHRKLSDKQVQKEVVRLLELTGIPQPELKKEAYPFELSGGQRQRVMIAMAIANKPKLLIADEPTTALDVTIQAQIIDLLMDLRKKMNMAILFISHDLTLVRKIADKICVMKNGEMVEKGDVNEIFENPKHPYTKELISAAMLKNENHVQNATKILQVADLRITFPLKKNFWGKITSKIDALNYVSLDVYRGECLGIVGESGSGKTTLGLSILGIQKAKGEVYFGGVNLTELSHKDKLNLKRKMQIVFQDPFNSLNPRMRIEDIVAEGLRIHYPKLKISDVREKVKTVLTEVGLDESVMERYPHEFSGGQRQRIAIARALILEPELIVLDEPTSALDVTIQAQIVKLLKKIQRERHISYLFISHDMRAVKAMADRIGVMKDGELIEIGSAKDIFEHPQNDYTKTLIRASEVR